jgi:putative transposase
MKGDSIWGFLLFDVLSDDGDWRAAARSGKVAGRPKHAFPIPPFEFREPSSRMPGRYALEAVDELGDRHLGRVVQREQRKLSRKVKFSNNWRKQKERIARLHLRIADARNDYLHKVSTEISKNHAMVVLEDLRVRNMSASAKGAVDEPGRNVRQKAGLNKAILDQGWHAFRRMLAYKLAWAGGALELMPPHHTSQTCPECGHVSKDNRQSQAVFRCEACGFEDHADHVAAINILRRAGHARIACGDTGLVGGLAQQPSRRAA